MVVGARQSFQFFRQITWFLRNNRALSYFRYQILHNLISTMKLKKSQSVKANFKLTTQATLRILNKYVALQNLSIYYTWKNIRKQYKTMN